VRAVWWTDTAPGVFLYVTGVFLKDARMNTVERIGLAGAARGATRKLGERREVPLPLLLVAMAVLCAVLGALTNVLWCAVVTSVVATVITLQRLRMEVHELREWAACGAVTAPIRRR
jgi:hypothetical protein